MELVVMRAVHNAEATSSICLQWLNQVPLVAFHVRDGRVANNPSPGPMTSVGAIHSKFSAPHSKTESWTLPGGHEKKVQDVFS